MGLAISGVYLPVHCNRVPLRFDYRFPNYRGCGPHASAINSVHIIGDVTAMLFVSTLLDVRLDRRTQGEETIRYQGRFP